MKKINLLLATLWVLWLCCCAAPKVFAQDKPVGSIVLKTALNIGEKISFKITTYNPEEDKLEVDGIAEPLIMDGANYHEYTVTKPEITIKGKPSLLYCERNKLTYVKIANIEEFGILNCNDNAIETLEVTNLPNLIWLRAAGNRLKGLDLSTTPNLNRLYVYDNQIRGKAMTDMIKSMPQRESGAKQHGSFFVLNESAKTEQNICLKSDVDLAKARNWRVYKFLGSNNAFGAYTGEVVIESPHVMMKTNKQIGDKLNLAITGLGELKIEGIKEALIADGKLHTYTIDRQDIKISGNVEDIYCPNNELTVLDVENQTTIRELRCPNNKIKELKLENNRRLIGLECSHNELTKLNLLENYYLNGLDCADNKITDLDCYAHINLIFLYCEQNALKRLNLAAAPKALVKLRCGDNQLSQLDLSKCPSLDGLECQNNQLTELSLQENRQLININVSGNKLTQLDLTNNPLIDTLACHNNKLSDIALADNSTLKSIVCFNNQLKAPAAARLMSALPQSLANKDLWYS